MTQPRLKRLNPFLRDAAVSFVPEMTDDQLVRVARRLTAWHPDVLVSRLSDFTALVQGIAVEAETAHDANLVTWAAISTEVREMLDTPAGRRHRDDVDRRAFAGAEHVRPRLS
jgi:hypothetical protein